MAKSNWRSEVHITADVDADEQTADKRLDRPFVIAVLGDFSGIEKSTGDQTAVVGRRSLVTIDRDNFDAVMQRLGVCWEGRLWNGAEEGQGITLAIGALDDFHPDRVVARVEPLAALLATRRRLLNPSQFDAAAAEVAEWAKAATPDAARAQASRPDVAEKTVEPGLLDRIVAGSESTARPVLKTPDASDLQRVVERIVAPHLIRIDTRRQAELVAAVDEALAQLLRAILHDARFQRLEAAWRSLWRLVTAVDSDVTLKVRLLQCTKGELHRDLADGGESGESQILRPLRDAAMSRGGQPAALLIGNFEFDHGAQDLDLLTRLGTAARRLGAPFVAAASPRPLGCHTFTEIPSARELARRFAEPAYQAWNAFRHSLPARSIALALPRVLCRLPYGAETDPTESCDFEEHVGGVPHGELLWGNPAFLVAGAVAVAFAADGWSMDLAAEVAHVEGLPLYVYQDDGVAVTEPCAEVLLNDSVVEALEEIGLLPLVTYRDTDAVALPCVQTVSVPRAPLRLGAVPVR